MKTDDYWDVRFALLEQIKLAFDEPGITFPFPQQDVHLYRHRPGEQPSSAAACPRPGEADANSLLSR